MNEIRFDLEDILSSNLTEDILCSIELMSEKVTFKKVVFWYNGGISKKQISEFMKRVDALIKDDDILINISQRTPQREYAWFDVINEQKVQGSKSRFSYIYPNNKKSEMIRGIHNYFDVASFIEKSGQGKRIYYKPKENSR